VARTLRVSVHAVVAGALLLAACIGIIIYQNHLIAGRFQDYIDIKYRNTDTEANLVYVRNRLAKCLGDRTANPAAGAQGSLQ